ncbi:hypothetical protein V9T40_008679 [Parthenolecanium corni]|uniref:Biogenesis of lysosome-related organelles complex 1 subunit 1 n=1 Tax=Parthenolecanium corni TaxID=536013 RepID=A0AAN9U075_9HEMI
MLSRLMKEHHAKQAERKEKQEVKRKDAIAAANDLTQALVEHLNLGVAQAYLNQKKIEEEVKQLHQNMAQFSKQTQQWVQLIGNFNGSLKQIGDLENWSRIMESDMKFISETLEHTYNGVVSVRFQFELQTAAGMHNVPENQLGSLHYSDLMLKMSCAPPPPPAPAPPLPNFSTAKSSNTKDDRGLLLDSIRKGTKLKKAETNDRSAPIVGSTSAKSSSNTNNAAAVRTTTNNRPVNDAPTTGGLGGLFVNGIPKLKATGLPIGQAYQQYRNETDAPASNKLVNNKNSGNPDADANEELPVHSRSGSAVSLNENHSYHNRPYNGNHQAVISHGKPSLAPKPPGFKAGSKNDGRSSVGRTLSLRLPRSPLSTTDVNNGKLTVRPRPAEKEGERPQFPDFNQSEVSDINNKNGLPSFHQSQESLTKHHYRPSSPSSGRKPWSSVSMNNVNATLRPYNRSHGSPLRPPSSRPPPPPPARMVVSPPMCPPPPPPAHAPPPPPHRVNPAPPPPPSVIQNRSTSNFSNSNVPPTPPTRNSSMRSSNTSSFESRYIFRNVDEFPPPQPYQNIVKFYNSKFQVAKQQAPKPPMQLHTNRVWPPCENTSNC